MCKNVHGNAADWIKRTQQVERIGRAKPENGLVARDDHERLQTQRTASQLFHTANEYQIKSNQIYFSVAGKNNTQNKKYTYCIKI